MNNVIMRKLVLSGDYQPLALTQVVGSFVISARPTNAADAVFRGDEGAEVPWVPGEWHALRNVDLQAIQVKGEPNDIVTIVGGTW